jgi:hypothetical protein
MEEEARNVYEKQLRLIEEDEACEVEAAHLKAALKRNVALRRYIHAKEKSLLSSSKKSYKADDAVQSKSENIKAPDITIYNIQQGNTNSTNSPTYNQNGDGGQYVAERMYPTPAANQ